jgi:tRNA (guanine37-N1)-methyltransferase
MAKAYFSPRLSHEHQRVAELVGKGESVVDLFAGVGPFAVPIAKSCKTAQVYAIDINAEAIDLLQQNARLNKVEGRVHAFVGDARRIVDEKLAGTADRVIMNLPETADAFIDVACKAVKSEGGIVHFYGFVRMPNTLEDFRRLFAEGVTRAGRKVVRFEVVKTVRETAPYEWQAVLDAEIK